MGVELEACIRVLVMVEATGRVQHSSILFSSHEIKLCYLIPSIVTIFDTHQSRSEITYPSTLGTPSSYELGKRWKEFLRYQILLRLDSPTPCGSIVYVVCNVSAVKLPIGRQDWDNGGTDTPRNHGECSYKNT